MRISSKLLPVAAARTRPARSARGGAPVGPVRPSAMPRDLAARTLEALAEAVVVHDASGRLAHANPAAVRLLGLGATGASAAAEPVAPDGSPWRADDHPTACCVRTGAACDDRLLGLRGARGTRWLRVSARPLRDGAGRTTAVVTTYADVTRAPEVARHREDDGPDDGGGAI